MTIKETVRTIDQFYPKIIAGMLAFIVAMFGTVGSYGLHKIETALDNIANELKVSNHGISNNNLRLTLLEAWQTQAVAEIQATGALRYTKEDSDRDKKVQSYRDDIQDEKGRGRDNAIQKLEAKIDERNPYQPN